MQVEQARKRLVVVDDEPDMREVFVAVARDAGFETMSLGDVGAFQKAYDEFRPDVIVMDVVMPGSDGVELVRWLVSRNGKPRVLVVSGYGSTYTAGAREIATVWGKLEVEEMQKPVRVADLRALLVRWRK
jgi:DNA-binding response OmpR family regulator